MKKVSKESESKHYYCSSFFCICSLGFVSPNVASAATTINLNSAANFAVLAGSGITNSAGPTTITGMLDRIRR